GEASGVAWVYVYADAVGASANADAAKGNALASTGTNSSSWQGFGAASGTATVPTRVVPLFFTCSSFTTGSAAANAAAGVGSRLRVSGTSLGSIIAHAAAMIVDPAPGQGTAKTGLRAFLRLENGKELEFWNAEAAVDVDPATGAAALAVVDSGGLLEPRLFEPYTLPDGRGGFASAGAGFDVTIPIPDLTQFLGQRIEINLESTASAASQAALPEERHLVQVGDHISAILRDVPITMRVEVGDWLQVAAEQLTSTKPGRFGLSLAALEHAFAGSLKFDRVDLSAAIGRIRRSLFGVHVDWEELPRVTKLNDTIRDVIRNLRFVIHGENRFTQCDLMLSLTVNGKTPATTGFSLDPRTTKLAQTGVVRWSFDPEDGERGTWSSAPDALGMKAGSNHLVVTLQTAKGDMLGSTDAFIVVDT
ncbi:MAG: hypothetical protein GY906_35505, partial [bacterium]|nr:hypothetical protein [bacterium]